MSSEFKLSSREFAENQDITLECLYSRLRRGQYKDLYKFEKKLLWFKEVRPINENDKGLDNSNDNSSFAARHSSPDPRSKKRERRRGVHAAGIKTKYPNAAFQQHNEIKMLARLKGKVSEEVINKITPETIKLAENKVREEKQKRLYEATKPIKNYGYGIYNCKTVAPRYRPIGKPITRDNDKGNWVNDLPGKPKEYY